uniref:B-like cyclin n=1 Tax=Fagus sylvatica TaxID=28930 RepID=A0A2N9G744_FAGSY
MKKEDTTTAKVEEPNVRITRARAKALGLSGGIFPSSKPSFKQDQKHVVCSKFKRAASDENKASTVAPAGIQHKRRAVLGDVTNVLCENSHMNYTHASKNQTSKQARRGPTKKNTKVVAGVTVEISPMQEDAKTKLAEELSKIRMVESQEIALPVKASTKPTGLQSFQKKEDMVCKKSGTSNSLDIVDIDSNVKDPQVCGSYAPDIYSNIRVVEVSEEYRLVPDTLYLTVNLIDRFLSQNYMEKTRLQLLGVTCTLIASKYEEICAPRVEEFCFITDNTYKRGEVLKLESRVLNFLYFQLSVPTTKTFLRRFIQAAQASYKHPSVELEFLANYLAELTLLEYSFLKFLPSLIAAAAVFLARWTLNQSDHPWNPTLEHYTSYKASELKTTVLALEDLQLNTKGCSLNAIREKYRQQKFKCVATMTSPQPALSLF